ncbi:VanZ family protein [Cohnella caldifontis]|uniref:VanZ family protein n=1 Tax=Cohnella caldifontis TaxID=3027471 RepID=UPI0023EB2514|nr:VanZ family protein [Cohnella sp. YIM B05605]
MPIPSEGMRGRAGGRRLWRWAPALIWMGAIFALSARSGGQLDTWLPFFRRLFPGLQSFNPMHYVAYFGLALTVAYGQGSRFWSWTGGLLNVLICVLYGVTDEWHQSYVPNRSPDVMDLLHDGIGAAAACLVLFVWHWRFRGKRARYYSSRKSRN